MRGQRDLTAKLSKELEARLAAKEVEREGVLKEAEKARRRDREAVEEVQFFEISCEAQTLRRRKPQSGANAVSASSFALDREEIKLYL